MPDRRVELLEQSIRELRDDVSLFIKETGRTLSKLEQGVEQVNGHVADVLSEIGTVPDHRYRESNRQTITGRLHKLENDSNAAEIAKEALKQASESRAHGWSRGQKIGAFVLLCVGTVIGILNAAGVT